MNTTSDLAALVSKKKVRIAGQGQDVSSFQGLIYARDSVEIRNTTVMGAIVSKDDAATTELENVTAVNVPELANWDIEQHLTLTSAMESQLGAGTSTTVGILETNGSFTPLYPSGNVRILKLLAASLAASDPQGTTWSIKAQNLNGTYSEISNLPVSARVDAINSSEKWHQYVSEHRRDEIITEPIFSIELNRLMSTSQKLELLYHNSFSD